MIFFLPSIGGTFSAYAGFITSWESIRETVLVAANCTVALGCQVLMDSAFYTSPSSLTKVSQSRPVGIGFVPSAFNFSAYL